MPLSKIPILGATNIQDMVLDLMLEELFNFLMAVWVKL